VNQGITKNALSVDQSVSHRQHRVLVCRAVLSADACSFITHKATTLISKERFSIMERKLYRGIMGPAMIATLIFGGWLI
jgi:hypothetical protein